MVQKQTVGTIMVAAIFPDNQIELYSVAEITHIKAFLVKDNRQLSIQGEGVLYLFIRSQDRSTTARHCQQTEKFPYSQTIAGYYPPSPHGVV